MGSQGNRTPTDGTHIGGAITEQIVREASH